MMKKKEVCVISEGENNRLKMNGRKKITTRIRRDKILKCQIQLDSNGG